MPIERDPTVDPRSTAYIGAIADNGMPLTADRDQYSIPVYVVDDNTPKATVKLSGFFSSYDRGDRSRVGGGPNPAVADIPVPNDAQGGPGTDGQIVLLDSRRGIEWGFWQFRRDRDGNYAATNGYRYHTTAGYHGRFADGLAGRGAGTPYLAGLVRPAEIAQGRIDHALAFAYDAPSSRFVYPASKSDGTGSVQTELPEGTRLQLDPSLGERDFDAWKLSPPARVIARALQTYGMYVIDHSGSSKIYLEDQRTARWAPDVNRDVVSAIPWSAFRVIAAPKRGVVASSTTRDNSSRVPIVLGALSVLTAGVGAAVWQSRRRGQRRRTNPSTMADAGPRDGG